jgi:hypothetical protein
MAKVQLSREQLARVLYAPNLNRFVAVTEAGSIREASRRLNISASAVSGQIMQLEEAVGIPLFERSPAGCAFPLGTICQQFPAFCNNLRRPIKCSWVSLRRS